MLTNTVPVSKLGTIFTGPRLIYGHFRQQQYLVKFAGLAGILNTTVDKTETISTGLSHGKMSYISTLHCTDNHPVNRQINSTQIRHEELEFQIRPGFKLALKKTRQLPSTTLL